MTMNIKCGDLKTIYTCDRMLRLLDVYKENKLYCLGNMVEMLIHTVTEVKETRCR